MILLFLAVEKHKNGLLMAMMGVLESSAYPFSCFRDNALTYSWNVLINLVMQQLFCNVFKNILIFLRVKSINKGVLKLLCKTTLLRNDGSNLLVESYKTRIPIYPIYQWRERKSITTIFHFGLSQIKRISGPPIWVQLF